MGDQDLSRTIAPATFGDDMSTVFFVIVLTYTPEHPHPHRAANRPTNPTNAGDYAGMSNETAICCNVTMLVFDLLFHCICGSSRSQHYSPVLTCLEDPNHPLVSYGMFRAYVL